VAWREGTPEDGAERSDRRAYDRSGHGLLPDRRRQPGVRREVEPDDPIPARIRPTDGEIDVLEDRRDDPTFAELMGTLEP
jgi:hypothetical protein